MSPEFRQKVFSFPEEQRRQYLRKVFNELQQNQQKVRQQQHQQQQVKIKSKNISLEK